MAGEGRLGDRVKLIPGNGKGKPQTTMTDYINILILDVITYSVMLTAYDWQGTLISHRELCADVERIRGLQQVNRWILWFSALDYGGSILIGMSGKVN